ncbi:MAG: hypothetical protein AAGH71_00980 [Planctomycetota bacterium]
MFAWGFMGLFVCSGIVPALAVVVLSVSALVRSLGSGKVRAPSCGWCGYEVTDVPGLACPECGRDFRTVGIVTRSIVGAHRGSMLQAQLAWLILMGLVGFIVWYAWVMLTVFSAGWGGAAWNQPVAVVGTITPPTSVTHSDIEVDVTSPGLSQPTTLVLIASDGDGEVHELTLTGDYDPVSSVLVSGGVEVSSRATVTTTAALTEWFDAVGIDDTTDPQGASRSDLTSFATTGLQSPAMSDQSYSMGSSSLTATSAMGTWSAQPGGAAGFGTGATGVTAWLGPVLMLSLVGVWVVGVVLIVRRRRSLLRLV